MNTSTNNISIYLLQVYHFKTTVCHLFVCPHGTSVHGWSWRWLNALPALGWWAEGNPPCFCDVEDGLIKQNPEKTTEFIVKITKDWVKKPRKNHLWIPQRPWKKIGDTARELGSNKNNQQSLLKTNKYTACVESVHLRLTKRSFNDWLIAGFEGRNERIKKNQNSQTW